MTYVSSLLIEDECDHLGNTLRKNKDIFAWNMPDIDLVVVFHELNILFVAWPVQQKVHHFHPDRQKII